MRDLTITRCVISRSPRRIKRQQTRYLEEEAADDGHGARAPGHAITFQYAWQLRGKIDSTETRLKARFHKHTLIIIPRDGFITCMRSPDYWGPPGWAPNSRAIDRDRNRY